MSSDCGDAAGACGTCGGVPRDASQVALSGSGGVVTLLSAETISSMRAERTLRDSFILSGTLMMAGSVFESLNAASTTSTPRCVSAAFVSVSNLESRCVIMAAAALKSYGADPEVRLTPRMGTQLSMAVVSSRMQYGLVMTF